MESWKQGVLGLVLAFSALLEFYAGLNLIFNTKAFIRGLYPNLEQEVNSMVEKYGITSGIGLTSIGLLSVLPFLIEPFMDEGCTRAAFIVLVYYNLCATANNYNVAGAMAPPTVVHAGMLIACFACTILAFV